MSDDRPQQIAQRRVIEEFIRRFPLPFPVNQPDEFKGSPPEGLNKPTDAEKDFRDLLNPAQRKAIQNSQQQDDNVRFAYHPTRDDHGCVHADLLIRNGTSAHELAVEAMTGDTTPNILITKEGGLAVFDAKFSADAPQRFQSDKGSLWEVEHIIPTNASERAAAQTHLASKIAQWNYQGKIAEQCGYKFKVGIADQELYEWASENLTLATGQIVQRSLAGTYKEVRAETVGGQVHHMPADNSLRQAGVISRGSEINRNNAPAIYMRSRDHKDTASNGSGPDAVAYRETQADLIRNGKTEQVIREDIQDFIAVTQHYGRSNPYIHALRQFKQHLNRDQVVERINEAAQQASVESNPLAAYWEANRERPPEIPIEVRVSNLVEQQSPADLQQVRTQVPPEAAEPVVLSQVPPEVIAVQDQAIAEQPQAPELNPILSPLEINEAQPDLESQRQETLGQTTNLRDTNAQNRIIPSDISNRPDIFTPPQSLEELAQQSADQMTYQTPAVLKQMEGIVNAYRASEPPNITSQHIDQAEQKLGRVIK